MWTEIWTNIKTSFTTDIKKWWGLYLVLLIIAGTDFIFGTRDRLECESQGGIYVARAYVFSVNTYKCLSPIEIEVRKK